MDVAIQARVPTPGGRPRVVRFQWRPADLSPGLTIRNLGKAIQAAYPPLADYVEPSSYAIFYEDQANNWICLKSDHELRHAIQTCLHQGQLRLRLEEVTKSGRLAGASPIRSSTPTPQGTPRQSTGRPMTPEGYRMSYSGPITGHAEVSPVAKSKLVWDENPANEAVHETPKKSAPVISYTQRRTPTKPTNTPPPKTDLYEPKKVAPTVFQQFYKRGDIPARICHGIAKNSLFWSRPINELDYATFIPLFFVGIQEQTDPASFIAKQGCLDLIDDEGSVEKLLPLMHLIVHNIRASLDTKHPQTMAWGLHLFNHLSGRDPRLAEALIPYYKYVIPTIRTYFNHRVPVDESHDAKRRKILNFNDVLMDTLRNMEQKGGEAAMKAIKRAIPTYQNEVPSLFFSGEFMKTE